MVNKTIYNWDFNLVQHVIHHNIQCKINTNGMRPTINEMIVQLTALGRNGQKIPGYMRCLVFGPKVFFYIQTKDHVKDCFIFNKIEEESVGNESKTSNAQVSPQMNCLVNTENNQLLMPQNNLIQNHSSLLTNCNMMNMHNQYPFLHKITCLLVQ